MTTVEALEINELYLTKGPKIASGAYGVVHRGTYFGEACAIKELHWNASSSDLDDFLDELAVQASLRCEYIVQVIGVRTKKEPVQLVMELMDDNLGAVLASPRELPLLTRVRLARQVACGLAFMHGQLRPVLHRDVKSLNVMVRWGREPVAKLGDLGLATVKRATAAGGRSSREVVGSYPWMAPEVMDLRPYTTKSDVFSFGTVLWEIVTRSVPFANAKEERSIERFVLDRGKRLPLPEGADKVLRSVVEKCWLQDPAQRPTMEQVAETLRSYERSLEALARPARALPPPVAAPPPPREAAPSPPPAPAPADPPPAGPAPPSPSSPGSPKQRPAALVLSPATPPVKAERPGGEGHRRLKSDEISLGASPARHLSPPTPAGRARRRSVGDPADAPDPAQPAAAAAGGPSDSPSSSPSGADRPRADGRAGVRALSRRALREIARGLRRGGYGAEGGGTPEPEPPSAREAAGGSPLSEPARTASPRTSLEPPAGGGAESDGGAKGRAPVRPPLRSVEVSGDALVLPPPPVLRSPSFQAALGRRSSSAASGAGSPAASPQKPASGAATPAEAASPQRPAAGSAAASPGTPGGKRLRKRISLSDIPHGYLDEPAAARPAPLRAPSPSPPSASPAAAASPEASPERRGPTPEGVRPLSSSLTRRILEGLDREPARPAASPPRPARSPSPPPESDSEEDDEVGAIAGPRGAGRAREAGRAPHLRDIGRPRSAPIFAVGALPARSPPPQPAAPHGPLASGSSSGGEGVGLHSSGGALAYVCGGCGRPAIKHADAHPHRDVNELLSAFYPRVRLDAQLTRARHGNGTLYDLWSVSCSGCFKTLGRARGKVEGPPGSWVFLLEPRALTPRGAAPSAFRAPALGPGSGEPRDPQELKGRCGSCLGLLPVPPSRKEMYVHEPPFGCGAQFHRPCASYAVIQLKRCPQCRSPWAADPPPAGRAAR